MHVYIHFTFYLLLLTIQYLEAECLSRVNEYRNRRKSRDFFSYYTYCDKYSKGELLKTNISEVTNTYMHFTLEGFPFTIKFYARKLCLTEYL